MKQKVTVVGAGNVGATTAQRIFERGYADVVLVDIVPDMPQGKALDILESGPVLGTDAFITGSNGYEATAGSDVVVVTAGIARRPGMSRDDLLLTNMKIVGAVTEEVAKYSPDCVLVVVSNPLDAMVQHAHNVCGFPSERVVGMAGILDTARFRTFLARELNVSVTNVSAYVLGGHGDTMVPLIGSTTIGGQPVAELIEATQARRDRPAHPGRWGRDRRTAQDRQRLLRAVGRSGPNGGRHSPRSKRNTPVRGPPEWPIRHRRPIRRGAGETGSGRRRRNNRDQADRRRERCLTQVSRRSAGIAGSDVERGLTRPAP